MPTKICHGANKNMTLICHTSKNLQLISNTNQNLQLISNTNQNLQLISNANQKPYESYPRFKISIKTRQQFGTVHHSQNLSAFCTTSHKRKLPVESLYFLSQNNEWLYAQLMSASCQILRNRLHLPFSRLGWNLPECFWF